jgi:tungstate transport system ATP-binding protein
MSAVTVVRNLTKTFGNRKVLDAVDLQVLDGEILALLGPNGSGKTTLLKILASILRPSDGEVHFDGVRVTDENVEKMRMQSSLVFQRTVMFSASVYDNVAYGLRMRRVSRSEVAERVARVLKLVKLEGFEKRQAKRLSGGEQQRVALARALALNTRLLLLDEPTANLDPKNAGIVEEVIATANRELKTTVVMATHNMFQAKSLPHRIALISDGRISEVGSPGEVFGKLSKTLVSFAVLDNTFSGIARVREDGVTVVDVGGGVQLEAAEGRVGEVRVLVSPTDIIVSRSPVSSSARNVIRGRVTEMRDLGGVVWLRVDAGRVFTVQITRSSFVDLGLGLGGEVFLVFKASSVQFL